LTFLPDAPLPALAIFLADAPSAELVFLAALLLAAVELASLAGVLFATSGFLGGVLCFVLLGIIDLLPMVRTVVGGTGVPGLVHLFPWSDAGS